MPATRSIPEYSIIVPVLDEAGILGGCLQGLQSLRGEKEIIVADGGSSDGSGTIAREHARVVVVSPPGRGRQMNEGARAARGRHLVFVHADCTLEPDALQHVDRVLARPGVAAGCFAQRIAGRGFGYRMLERFASWRAVSLQICYGDSGLFLSRERFASVGGFPEVPLFEDLGISRRLRRSGRIAIAPSVITVSARRWETHGLVKTTLVNWLLTSGYLLGVSEHRLSRLYYRSPRWRRDHRSLESS